MGLYGKNARHSEDGVKLCSDPFDKGCNNPSRITNTGRTRSWCVQCKQLKSYPRGQYVGSPKFLSRRTKEGKRRTQEGWKRYISNPRSKRLKKENDQRRRARLKGASINDFTEDEWEEIKKSQKDRCFYCGEEASLERDHWIPLSRGGDHTCSNIVGSCGPCNRLKSTRTGEEFLELLYGLS